MSWIPVSKKRYKKKPIPVPVCDLSRDPLESFELDKLNAEIALIERLEKELFPVLSVADIRAIKKQLESAVPAVPPIIYYDKQALEALKREFFKYGELSPDTIRKAEQ